MSKGLTVSFLLHFTELLMSKGLTVSFLLNF